MAIDTVVRGIQAATDEPFPEWRMIGVECGVPILIPVEKFGVLAETLREILFAETLEDMRIVQVGLGNEARRRAYILFFLPVNRDLGLGQFRLLGTRFPFNLLLFNDLRHGNHSSQENNGTCCLKPRARSDALLKRSGAEGRHLVRA